jgi:peptidyl-tRNA hydrolase
MREERKNKSQNAMPFPSLYLTFTYSTNALLGHNGLKSLNDTLGNRDYTRIRIGVGRPVSRDRTSVAEYALGPIPGDILRQCSWDEITGKGGTIVEQVWTLVEQFAKELAEEEAERGLRRKPEVEGDLETT